MTTMTTSSFLSPFKDFFLFLAGNTPPNVMDVASSCEQLDERLLLYGWSELQPLLSQLEQVQERLQAVKHISTACRTNGIGLSAAQGARVSRLCDLMDGLPALQFPLPVLPDAPHGECSLYSQLPDAESLQLYLGRVRARCKVIEEVAASRKNETVRFKHPAGGVHDLSLIRKEVRALSASAEAAEPHLLGGAAQLYSRVKGVHRAQQEIALGLGLGPAASVSDEEVQRGVDELVRLRGNYDIARGAAVLQEIANWRREMIAIEQTVRTLTRIRDEDCSEGLLDDPRTAQQLADDGVDVELVRAYWTDWRRREALMEDSIRSPACVLAYAQLTDARALYRAAERNLLRRADAYCGGLERLCAAGERESAFRKSFRSCLSDAFRMSPDALALAPSAAAAGGE